MSACYLCPAKWGPATCRGAHLGRDHANEVRLTGCCLRYAGVGGREASQGAQRAPGAAGHPPCSSLRGGSSGNDAAADAAPAAAPGDGDLRVLIAEDNLVNQKVLLKVLQRIMPRGTAFVANNGAEALEVRGAAFPPLPARMPYLGRPQADRFLIIASEPCSALAPSVRCLSSLAAPCGDTVVTGPASCMPASC